MLVSVPEIFQDKQRMVLHGLAIPCWRERVIRLEPFDERNLVRLERGEGIRRSRFELALHVFGREIRPRPGKTNDREL
jgi:hypothetical protein